MRATGEEMVKKRFLLGRNKLGDSLKLTNHRVPVAWEIQERGH